MGQIISHPEERDRDEMPLIEHHKYVAEQMSQALTDEKIDTLTTEELGYYIGALHDCGKATERNQKYLRTGDDTYQHDHSFISSTIAFSFLKQIGASEREIMIACYVIAKHHSTFNNDDILSYFRNKMRTYNNDIRPLIQDGFDNKSSEQFLDKTFGSLSDASFGWNKLRKHLLSDNFDAEFYKTMKAQGNINDTVYQKILTLWASLAFADIIHASSPNLDYTSKRVTSNSISKYVDTLPSEGTLNKLRNDVRSDILSTTEELNWDDFEVAYLPVPTGGGKTLAGLNAASELVDTHTQSSNDAVSDKGRIIYALPFTSIIDQTEDVFNNIIEQANTSINDENLMVKHHYLADTRVNSGNGPDTDRFLGESWRSGWVLTTFVQLFESLLVPSRGQSSKLPSLKNSIIILDEPQTLPNTWWPLIQRLAQILTEEYNARIISMTATQPYIFNDFDTVELPTNTESYFDHSAIDRVNYKFDSSVIDENTVLSHGSFVKRIYDNSCNGEDSLVVCNTIDSAYKTSEMLWKKQNIVNLNELLADWSKSNKDASWLGDSEYLQANISDNDIVVGHVSSRHRMKDRRRLLSALDTKPTDATFVLVSTQLIEAGVDISFEKTYRDFAPLQNIVQAAGRCNREGEVECGEVSVIQLDHPNEDDGKLPSRAIYERGQGTNLLAKTRTALKESLNSFESDVVYEQKQISYDSTKMYFSLLKDANIGKEQYVEWINESRFKDLRRLSMIDSAKTVDVYAAVNPSEIEVVSKMKEAVGKRQYSEFDSIAQENSDLLVSIPLYTEEDAEKATHAFDKIGKNVNQHSDSKHYSFLRGLEIPESTADSRLL